METEIQEPLATQEPTQEKGETRKTAKPKPSRLADTAAYAAKILDSFRQGQFDVEVDTSRDDAGTGLIKAIASMQASLLGIFSEMSIAVEMAHKGYQSLHSKIKSVRENATMVQSESDNIAKVTTELNTNMSTVSAAAEELSVSMKGISGFAKASKENIDFIEVGTQELTVASQEIAGSTEKATEISRRALENVAQATRLVSELEVAAREISAVTLAISEISDQTKLLALNATIEAARAGEAGRGFAVVAKEVKDLASQTNVATKDIQGKIEIIQSVTNRTITAIDSISRVMKEVDGVVTSIAAATEEQSATTKSIASNIADTTSHIKEMSASVQEGAVAVSDVNKSMATINKSSGEIAGSILALRDKGANLNNDASISFCHLLELTGLSEDLKDSLAGIVFPSHLAINSGSIQPTFCRFSDKYSVSITSMDSDHAKIFEFINRVHGGIKNQLPMEKLGAPINELALFTKEHFEREEQLLAANSYPGLPEHQAIHLKLLERLEDYRNKIKIGGELNPVDLLVFLKDWLQTHILGYDKLYEAFLKERGIH